MVLMVEAELVALWASVLSFAWFASRLSKSRGNENGTEGTLELLVVKLTRKSCVVSWWSCHWHLFSFFIELSLPWWFCFDKCEVSPVFLKSKNGLLLLIFWLDLLWLLMMFTRAAWWYVDVVLSWLLVSRLLPPLKGF